MRQCFGEALVAGERVGVQCADGLQGPEREREEEEEKKGVRRRLPTVGSHFSLTPSLKSIETVKYDLISASQLHSVSADCEFVVARVFCFFLQPGGSRMAGRVGWQDESDGRTSRRLSSPSRLHVFFAHFCPESAAAVSETHSIAQISHHSRLRYGGVTLLRYDWYAPPPPSN